MPLRNILNCSLKYLAGELFDNRKSVLGMTAVSFLAAFVFKKFAKIFHKTLDIDLSV